MSQVTAVTLSDGTVVNTFPNSIDGELVSRAFTELFAQIQSQATDIAENDAIIDQLRADLAARATAEQLDQKLDKRAQVSNTRFGVGVKWSTVIGAAQRYHDYVNTPEKEGERIEKAKAFLDTFTSAAQSDRPNEQNCGCKTCRPITMADMRMIVCATCGNKRCPHATDHRNGCTGRNEPGQLGSSYAAIESRRSGDGS